MENLERLNVRQLKQLAKELKIKGRSKFQKEDFIISLKRFPDDEIIKLIKQDNIINNNYKYFCIHGKNKYRCKECWWISNM